MTLNMYHKMVFNAITYLHSLYDQIVYAQHTHHLMCVQDDMLLKDLHGVFSLHMNTHSTSLRQYLFLFFGCIFLC